MSAAAKSAFLQAMRSADSFSASGWFFFRKAAVISVSIFSSIRPYFSVGITVSRTGVTVKSVTFSVRRWVMVSKKPAASISSPKNSNRSG